MSDALDTVR